MGMNGIMTYLIFKDVDAEITELEFESPGTALKVDLEGDKSVRRGRRRRGHDEQDPFYR